MDIDVHTYLVGICLGRTAPYIASKKKNPGRQLCRRYFEKSLKSLLHTYVFGRRGEKAATQTVERFVKNANRFSVRPNPISSTLMGMYCIHTFSTALVKHNLQLSSHRQNGGKHEVDCGFSSRCVSKM